MAHDVFISYSTKDKEIVEKLATYLEQNGILCWIAYKDIPAGRDWADFIPQAIKECKMMIYVHSSRSNPSKEIDKEIALSLKAKHPILPFKIEDVEYSGSKAYHLATINWIDAFPNPEKCFGKLVSQIKRTIHEIENSDNYEDKPKNEKPIEKIAKKTIEKESKKKNYLWLGIAGITVVILAIFGFMQYNNNSKVTADFQAYSELIEQADNYFSNGENYYAAVLDNYQKALIYESDYANTKYAEKFDSGVESKKKNIETTINTLVDDYKAKAVVFEDCDDVICLEELSFYYSKIKILQPDNQEVTVKLENCKKLLSQQN